MIAESIPVFFADFGEEVIYDGSTAIYALYDDAYQSAAGLVESTNPILTVDADDVPGVAIGDAMTVRSVDYTIQGIEPDSTGKLLVLQLEKV